MDGLKETLQYAVELAQPNIVEHVSGNYSDKKLFRLEDNLRAEPIQMTTLTSLIDYIKSDTDPVGLNKMLVHVVSPTEVKLISCLDADRKREILIIVNADIPTFPFGKFINHEEFIIALQSKFIANDDRELVLKFAGTVEDGTVAQYGDDGITQKATVKQGITGKTDAIVPNPVSLIPYRTFQEVEQPESNFIFRMKSDKYEGIVCAIFEADGGAWKNEATLRIKEYLAKELVDLTQLTVIS